MAVATCRSCRGEILRDDEAQTWRHAQEADSIACFVLARTAEEAKKLDAQRKVVHLRDTVPDVMDNVVRILARHYKDHPHYREQWAPDSAADSQGEEDSDG